MATVLVERRKKPTADHLQCSQWIQDNPNLFRLWAKAQLKDITIRRDMNNEIHQVPKK